MERNSCGVVKINGEGVLVPPGGETYRVVDMACSKNARPENRILSQLRVCYQICRFVYVKDQINNMSREK